MANRRIGAFVKFDKAKAEELVGIVEDFAERTQDLTPVMAVIASDDLKPDMIEHLQVGAGWPPKAETTIERQRYRGVSSTHPGIGEHGGFVPTVQRSWSKRNAVAFTRAPHAHLFELGTAEHFSSFGTRTFIYNENKRHVSRGESRSRLLKKGFSLTHQPPRPFAYISDDVEARGIRRIGAFIVGDDFHAAF